MIPSLSHGGLFQTTLWSRLVATQLAQRRDNIIAPSLLVREANYVYVSPLCCPFLIPVCNCVKDYKIIDVFMGRTLGEF